MNIFRYSRNLLKSNEQGTLILQGLIATAIFGVFMTSVVYMMTGTIRYNKAATRITEATTIGSDILEEIGNLPLDDPTLAGPGSFPNRTVGDYTVIVTPQPGLVMPNTISIDVEVRWRDPTGQIVVGGTRIRSIVMQDTLTQI